MPSLTLAAAVARRSFGGHGGSSSAAVFDANVRKWFSCFGKIEEGAAVLPLSTATCSMAIEAQT